MQPIFYQFQGFLDLRISHNWDLLKVNRKNGRCDPLINAKYQTRILPDPGQNS